MQPAAAETSPIPLRLRLPVTETVIKTDHLSSDVTHKPVGVGLVDIRLSERVRKHMRTPSGGVRQEEGTECVLEISPLNPPNPVDAMPICGPRIGEPRVEIVFSPAGLEKGIDQLQREIKSVGSDLERLADLLGKSGITYREKSARLQELKGHLDELIAQKHRQERVVTLVGSEGNRIQIIYPDGKRRDYLPADNMVIALHDDTVLAQNIGGLPVSTDILGEKGEKLEMGGVRPQVFVRIEQRGEARYLSLHRVKYAGQKEEPISVRVPEWQPHQAFDWQSHQAIQPTIDSRRSPRTARTHSQPNEGRRSSDREIGQVQFELKQAAAALLEEAGGVNMDGSRPMVSSIKVGKQGVQVVFDMSVEVARRLFGVRKSSLPGGTSERFFSGFGASSVGTGKIKYDLPGGETSRPTIPSILLPRSKVLQNNGHIAFTRRSRVAISEPEDVSIKENEAVLAAAGRLEEHSCRAAFKLSKVKGAGGPIHLELEASLPEGENGDGIGILMQDMRDLLVCARQGIVRGRMR